AAKADPSREAEIIDELFRLDGIGEAQLFPLLAKIQGNLLLVLDTCYSATLPPGMRSSRRRATKPLPTASVTRSAASSWPARAASPSIPTATAPRPASST